MKNGTYFFNRGGGMYFLSEIFCVSVSIVFFCVAFEKP